MNPAFELNHDLFASHHVPRDEVGSFPIIRHAVRVEAVGRKRARYPLEIKYLLLARIQLLVADFSEAFHLALVSARAAQESSKIHCVQYIEVQYIELDV